MQMLTTYFAPGSGRYRASFNVAQDGDGFILGYCEVRIGHSFGDTKGACDVSREDRFTARRPLLQTFGRQILS